ncbi:MAG: hypothetical protein FVQ85_21635 [Planctomycetes bacterium]|nr:hypothetical protein [Planctomycetota bacterium]
MNPTLLCDSSAKVLGIIDDNGHWDMEKFHEHVISCEVCLDLMETFFKVMRETKRGDLLNGKKAKKVPNKRNRARTV